MIRVDTRDLARLGAALVGDLDTEPLARELAEVSERQTQDRFSRRVDPFGRRWPQRQDNLPHPLLEKTGRMRRSIDTESDDEGVTVETKGVEYAAVHQWGYSARNIPQRAFLGFGPR